MLLMRYLIKPCISKYKVVVDANLMFNWLIIHYITIITHIIKKHKRAIFA